LFFKEINNKNKILLIIFRSVAYLSVSNFLPGKSAGLGFRKASFLNCDQYGQ